MTPLSPRPHKSLPGLPHHPGLWLDRCLADYFRSPKEGWVARRDLYERAIQSLTLGVNPAGDTPAVQVWRALQPGWKRAALGESGSLTGIACRAVEVETTSRLLLHPNSGGSITEGSILLHHTYGVPYLPGSALKGRVRQRLWDLAGGGHDRDPEISNHLLGFAPRPGEEGAASASWLEFLDAMWIPELPQGIRTRWSPLALDIVNPHHPQYYTSKGQGQQDRPPPRPTDDPIPVHRLTISPGTRFLLVVRGPNAPEFQKWLSWVVYDVLVPALEEDGLGAVTRVGYGRMSRRGPRPAESTAPPPRRASVQAQPTWQRGTLYRNPGNGELSLTTQDGRRAMAGGTDAATLFGGLSDKSQKALRDRKPVGVEATLEALGNRWILRALREVL